MIRSFLVYLPSVVVPRLAAILTIIAGSHFLAPDVFGYLSLVTFIGEFAEMTTANWSRIAMSRFGSSHDGVSRAFGIKMGWVAVACCSFAILCGGVAAYVLAHERFEAVFAALCGYILSAAFVRYGVTVLQAASQRARASMIESTRACLTLVAVLGTMYMTKDFMAASLAGSGVNLVAGVFAVRVGLKATRPDLVDAVSWAGLLRFAVPLILLAVFSQLIASSDKALLKHYHDATMLGFYGVAFALGRSGFDVIATSYNIGGFVHVSALANSGRLKDVPAHLSLQMGHILSLALPAAGVLIALRDVLAAALFPSGYAEAIHVAVPLVAAGAIALNMKNFVYDNVFYIYLKNLRQIPTLAAGACAALVTGFVLLPVEPLAGAATMFAVGGVVSLGASVLLTRSLATVPLPVRTMGASAVLALMAWGLLAAIQPIVLANIGAWGALFVLGGIGAVITALSFGLCVMRERHLSVRQLIARRRGSAKSSLSGDGTC